MVSKAAKYALFLLANNTLRRQHACAVIIVLQVSTELLQQYLDLEKNVILRFFLRFAGKRLVHDTFAIQYLHFTESGHIRPLHLHQA